MSTLPERLNAPSRAEVDALMKRCQIGVGGRNALDNAHSIMAECYGTLGALMLEIERLQADALRYRWIRSFQPSPLGSMDTARQLGLDLRQTYISAPEKLDAAIDAAMASQAERA